MKSKKITPTPGYFLITLAAHNVRPRTGVTLLRSNSERARIIAALQDTLSPRPFVRGETQTAHAVDLLAFSIIRTRASFVVFALSTDCARSLGKQISVALLEFQNEINIYKPSQDNARVHVSKLAGPHDALHATTRLHARHEDWEYDRYSSIGFYLHGRRGGWMRLWRLTPLYDNSPESYRALQEATLSYSPARIAVFTPA